MLLWHGSRTTNFAGILSQGLRIAPPEAPVVSYLVWFVANNINIIIRYIFIYFMCAILMAIFQVSK